MKYENGIKDRQTALKWANKYAEAYQLLEKETIRLKKENTDLKSNLQINKEIIQGFFMKGSMDNKINMFMDKLKEENSNHINRINALEMEIKDLRKNIVTFNQIKEENDSVKTKIFIFENIISEKDNKINYLKTKLSNALGKRMNAGKERVKDKDKEKEKEKDKDKDKNKKYADEANDNDNTIMNEIIVTSPTPVINKLNDKWSWYQEILKRLSDHIKSLKTSNEKKDKIIHQLEANFSKVQEELKALKLSQNNFSIWNQLNNEDEGGSKKRNRSQNHIPITNSTLSNTNININNTSAITANTNNISKFKQNIITKIEELEEISKSKKQMTKHLFDLTEEWYETLKQCNWNQADYVKYCHNKQTVKWTDVIECLYKLLIEKNVQIQLLTQENDALNWENLKISKINLELTEEIDNKGNKDNSQFVNCNANDDSYIRWRNNVWDYIKEIKQTVTSSEFREGMIWDEFDWESEISKDLKNLKWKQQGGSKENGGWKEKDFENGARENESGEDEKEIIIE